MSCDCRRVYAGPTQSDNGTISSIPPTGSAGEMGSEPVTGHFCWKCFAFWAVVAVIVLWIIDERE